MKNNHKSILFSTSILIVITFTLVANTVVVNAPVRPMQEIQIFVTKVVCTNLPAGAWYSLTLYPEYLRLFAYYGDELTQDSNYEDWYGGSFLYPPGMSYGSHTYYNDLYCSWSLCMDFDQEEITGIQGEVYLKYKLTHHKSIPVNQYMTVYYDTNSYDTEFYTRIYYGMGTVDVYLTFLLLS